VVAVPTLPNDAVNALAFGYYGEGDAGVVEVKWTAGVRASRESIIREG